MHYEHHLVDCSNNLTVGRQKSEPCYWHYSVVSKFYNRHEFYRQAIHWTEYRLQLNHGNILYIVIKFSLSRRNCSDTAPSKCNLAS